MILYYIMFLNIILYYIILYYIILYLYVYIGDYFIIQERRILFLTSQD